MRKATKKLRENGSGYNVFATPTKFQISKKYTPDAKVILYPGNTLDLLSSLPTGFAKLIISSPPYNLGKQYEKRTALKSYLASQEKIIAELGRVLADDGSVCWQVGNYVDKGEVYPLDIFYYDSFKDIGLKLRNRIIWHFGHGLHTSHRFSGRYETLLWFTKTDNYVFNLDPVRVPSKYPGKRHYKGPKKGQLSGNPNGKNPSDVWEQICVEWEDGFWDIPNVKNNHPEKTSHPCQFPVELVERCVLALTNEEDWVLDPYAGVGSALIAGLKNGRRVAGAEKELTYVDIASERIQKLAKGTLKLRPLGKPVYAPTGKEAVAQIPLEWQHR